MLKSVLLASVAVIAGSSAASATPTPYDWNGFYAGVFAGGGDLNSHWTGTLGDGGPIDQKLDGAGGIFGGFVGFNVQSDNLVYGGEGDFGYFHTSDKRTVPASGGEGLDIISTSDGLGSVRGRIGWAADNNVLVYVTAGAGFLVGTNHWRGIHDVTGDINFDVGPNVGWVAGGGLEYVVCEDVTVRVEGLYYDFGTASNEGSNLDFTDHGNVAQSIALGRIGVAFKL